MLDELEVTAIKVLPADNHPHYPQRARVTVVGFGAAKTAEVPYRVYLREFTVWGVNLKHEASPQLHYGGVIFKLVPTIVEGATRYFAEAIGLMIRTVRETDPELLPQWQVVGWSPFSPKELTDEL